MTDDHLVHHGRRWVDMRDRRTEMPYRYYLTEGGGPEREVSKADFVNAERKAGFRNTLSQPDEPGTAGFSVCRGGESPLEIRGRVEDIPADRLWPCGCLRNDGDAHRVGCPEYPEGRRGER